LRNASVCRIMKLEELTVEGGSAMEHWDTLCPDGLRFCWDESAHKPGTDAFLLGGFPRLRPGLRVCDLGSGTGLLGLLLLQRQRELRVTGVELQEPAAALAVRAAAENGLQDRLATLRADLRDIRSLLSAGSFDLCVSNPPLFLRRQRQSRPGRRRGGLHAARRTARFRTCAGRRHICSAGAGTCVSCTGRSGCATLCVPCGKTAWSQSGCAW